MSASVSAIVNSANTIQYIIHFTCQSTHNIIAKPSYAPSV